MDSLVQRKLFLILSKERGLRVADDEIRENIEKSPAFQKNGNFDKDTYIRILQLNRLTPESYEKEVREELVVEKVRRLILEIPPATTDIKDEELRIEEYLKDFKKKLKVEIYEDKISREEKGS